MSELVPRSTESETDRREFWDGFILSLDELSKYIRIDVMEEIKRAQNQDEEYAIGLLFKYAGLTELPLGESGRLPMVSTILKEAGCVDLDSSLFRDKELN